MTKPVRLQLSRRKGFDLQALSMATNGLPAVDCSRPGKWGNPFKVGEEYQTVAAGPRIVADVDDVVRLFRETHRANFEPVREALRGKNLACWCKPGAPCHADVLLEIANAEPSP